MKILHRDDLHRGGFAGLREHRLVTDKKAWGPHADPAAWQGLGNFVYLADATFRPKGETRMHPHKEIDVISFMINGRVAHEGSLEHGEILENYDVQVQRAGGEGFTHNEVNPDDEWNRMIQLWVLPERLGESAGYKKYQPKMGELTTIYGGDSEQTNTYAAKTEISVALLTPGQEIQLDDDFMTYITKGSGVANNESVTEGDLIMDENFHFVANDDVHMIIVQVSK